MYSFYYILTFQYHKERRVETKSYTMDAGYLKREVGVALRKCLAEVAEKRPYDPIEFIAHWLYKFTDNKNFEEQVRRMTWNI